MVRSVFIMEAPSCTTAVRAVVAAACSAVAAALALAWWQLGHDVCPCKLRQARPGAVSEACGLGCRWSPDPVMLRCIDPYFDLGDSLEGGRISIAAFIQGLEKTLFLTVEVALTCGLYYLDLYTDAGVLNGFCHAGKLASAVPVAVL